MVQKKMRQFLLVLLLIFSTYGIANEQDKTIKIQGQEPESGTIVFPIQQSEHNKPQCLTICKEWGEECVIASGAGDPRTGGGVGRRHCRRVCKSLGQECF